MRRWKHCCDKTWNPIDHFCRLTNWCFIVTVIIKEIFSIRYRQRTLHCRFLLRLDSTRTKPKPKHSNQPKKLFLNRCCLHPLRVIVWFVVERMGDFLWSARSRPSLSSINIIAKYERGEWKKIDFFPSTCLFSFRLITMSSGSGVVTSAQCRMEWKLNVMMAKEAEETSFYMFWQMLV